MLAHGVAEYCFLRGLIKVLYYSSTPTNLPSIFGKYNSFKRRYHRAKCVEHVCNPCPEDARAGGLQVQDQSPLHVKYQASVDYTSFFESGQKIDTSSHR